MLALTAGCIAGCMDTQKENLTADEISSQYIGHQEDVRDYSAVLSRTTGLMIEIPVIQKIKITVKKPHCYRIEYLESPKQETGTLAISDGNNLWWYYPSVNQYQHTTVSDPAQTIFTELDYQTTISRILEENKASCIGEEVIDGDLTYILEIIPDDPLKYSPALFSQVRVWIDSNSWMLKKTEFFYESDIPVIKAEYIDIQTNTDISDEICTFIPPNGAQQKPIPEMTGQITPLFAETPEQARDWFGEDLPVPSYLPDGYLFLYALHYGGPENRTSLIYGHEDGDEIHITQAPLRGRPCLEAVAGEATEVMVNGTPSNLTFGETENTLRWCSEEYSYCITGVVEEDEMLRMAASTLNGDTDKSEKKSAEEIRILDSDEERVKEIGNTFAYISSDDSDWVLTNGGDIILVSGTVPDFTKEVNKIIWDEKLRNVISDSRSDLKKYITLNDGPLICYGLNYLGSIEVGWYENITADPIILNEICNIFYSSAEEEGIKDLPIVVKYSSQVKGDVSGSDNFRPGIGGIQMLVQKNGGTYTGTMDLLFLNTLLKVQVLPYINQQ